MWQFFDDIERAIADSDSKYKINKEDFKTTIETETKKRLPKHGSILE